MLVTKTDISIACESTKISAPVTSTETKPSASGSAAAASEPKTSSRISSTIGKPADSALARSSLESSCIAAHSAPWPTKWVATPSRGAVGDAEPVAQVGGDVGRVVLVDRRRAAGRRPSRRRAARSAPARGPPAGSETPSTGPAAAATRVDRGARAAPRVAPGCGIEHRGELRAAATPGKPLERAVDGGRLRARARRSRRWRGPPTGARRTGRREQDDRGPDDQDGALAAAQQAVEAQHGGLHRGAPDTGWLASQVREGRTACVRRAHTAVAQAIRRRSIVPFIDGPCTVQMNP